MEGDRVLIMVFGAAMTGLALVIAWGTAESGLCDLPLAREAIVSHSATWCFEFWLNRYQTLLTGACTLIAASIAAWFVWRQTRVAQRQVGIMLGDVDPDVFLVAAESMNHDFTLTIANQNRRPIVVEEVAVVEPPELELLLHAGPGLARLNAPDDRNWHIRSLVPGTRPAAGEVNQQVIEGRFALTDAPEETPRIGRAVLRVVYVVLDEPPLRRSVTFSLENARVSIRSFTAAGATHAVFQGRAPVGSIPAPELDPGREE